ncbi:unnamed protein product [Closterium sp. NIES-65]|nr:unnamed protein product [Closterium sp. NIES-65]
MSGLSSPSFRTYCAPHATPPFPPLSRSSPSAPTVHHTQPLPSRLSPAPVLPHLLCTTRNPSLPASLPLQSFRTYCAPHATPPFPPLSRSSPSAPTVHHTQPLPFRLSRLSPSSSPHQSCTGGQARGVGPTTRASSTRQHTASCCAGCWPNHARFFDPAAYRIVLCDQRGAGKSTPAGCVVENRTDLLVGDIEAIREHLKVDR